jgi:hypothetical protein
LFNPEEPYQNRDPRLDLSVEFEDEIWLNADGSVYSHSDPTETGYSQEKYIDNTLLPIDYDRKSEQDYVHIRYADILLMYAEAKNEHTGRMLPVFKAVNDVRGRAGINMPPIAADLNQADLRKAIRHERRIKMALEGFRYFDLQRWKELEHIMNGGYSREEPYAYSIRTSIICGHSH